MKRKVIFFVLFSLLIGSSACRVITAPINRIYLPSEEEILMGKLAETLSDKLCLPLSPEDDLNLYSFVADWLKVPYRFGQMSKKGTDCSGFVAILLSEVYGKEFGRTSAANLYKATMAIKDPKKLREGDLVFFNINNRLRGNASHVGVYLRDELFVHASTRKGVTISSLKDPYYKRSYMRGGRLH